MTTLRVRTTSPSEGTPSTWESAFWYRFEVHSRHALGLTALLLTSCSLALDPKLSDTGDGPFGAACIESYECQSGLCSDGRCSAECSVDEPCPEGGVCEGSVCRSLSPAAKERLQVGLLYVGPVGDHGWTKAHDDGRMYFLGELEDTTAMFAPSVMTADAEARIEEFIARGDNVVIGTSFDFLVPMQEAAERHPDVNFLLCSGFVDGPNLGSYFGRMYQAMYQAGQLAGLMTNEDRIGLVGPVVIPETVRHANAFTLGVRSVNPDARVVMRWVYAWFDPAEEEAAANELLDAGVDIVFSHTDTTIAIETANARNSADTPIYTIGYDNPDSCDFAPETCIGSAYWNWGPLVTRLLRNMQTGTWRPDEQVWEPMRADPSQSTVYLQMNEANVPSSTRIEVEGLVADLSRNTPEGLYLPFRGPVMDNTGGVRIEDGALPTDEDLLSMCWFVDGIYDLDDTPAVVPTQCMGDR